LTGYPIGDPDVAGSWSGSRRAALTKRAAVLGGMLANLLGLTAAPTGVGLAGDAEWHGDAR
jgi:hypothetical protein